MGNKAGQIRVGIGRNVIVERKDSDTSIPVLSPAIITRDHGNGVINCRVFEDGHHIPWLESIPKKHALRADRNEVQPLNWWFWPPRSPAARAEGEAERRMTAGDQRLGEQQAQEGQRPDTERAGIPHQGVGAGQGLARAPTGPGSLASLPHQGVGGHRSGRSGPPRERVARPEDAGSERVPGPSQTVGPLLPGDPGYQQPTPDPVNPDGSRYDPAKEEAKPPPAEEKPGDRLDRSGPSMPSTGYGGKGNG